MLQKKFPDNDTTSLFSTNVKIMCGCHGVQQLINRSAGSGIATEKRKYTVLSRLPAVNFVQFSTNKKAWVRG